MIAIDLDFAISRFIEKSRDYPPEAYKFLGARAQFVEVSKKFFKLRRGLWEGKKLEGEDVGEICEDLIGHMLITLNLIRTEA